MALAQPEDIVGGTFSSRMAEGIQRNFERLFREVSRLSALVAALIASSASSSSSAVVMTDFTQDLGVAQRSGTFDLTGLTDLTTGKVVTVVQTAAAIATKGNARDEAEMSQISATGYVVSSTTIRVYWWCHDVVVGVHAFAYSVNG